MSLKKKKKTPLSEKEKVEKEEKYKKRNLYIKFTLILVLFVSIIFACIMIPINLYNQGLTGDYDSKCQLEYKEVLKQDEEKYYVYMYLDNSEYCQKLKPTILSYQRSDMQKTNCKLYTYNIKDDLYNLVDLYNGTENVQNITTMEELKITEVPVLMLIFQTTNESSQKVWRVVSYVKGNEAITKQLNIVMNYTLN